MSWIDRAVARSEAREARAEVKRLRAEMERLQMTERERDEARAELERLRAGLREVYDCIPAGWDVHPDAPKSAGMIRGMLRALLGEGE